MENNRITYQHGGEMYDKNIRLDFSININPFGMPETVKNKIISEIEAYKNYPDDFCRELRNAIAQKENISEDWILCGNGAADMIYRLCYAKRPKKALLLAPTFSEYEKALLQVGCKIDYYQLQEGQNFSIQEDFFSFLKEELDIVFLCNPNNPVGNIIPMPILERINDICKENGIFLAIDECFMEFTEKKNSMIKKIGENPHSCIIKAFTKTYAMAGIRLGYIICSDRNLLHKIKEAGAPWSVSIPAQKAGIAALKEKEYLLKTIAYLKEEREFLEKELKKLGCIVFPSEANYILWKFEPLIGRDLYQKMLEKKILIRQCANYRGLGEHYYRICIGLHEENKCLLEQLEKCLEESKWQK